MWFQPYGICKERFNKLGAWSGYKFRCFYWWRMFMFSFCAAHTTGYVLDFTGIFMPVDQLVMLDAQWLFWITPWASASTVEDLLKTERVVIYTELVIYTGLVFTCRNATLHTSFLPFEFVWLSIILLFQTLPHIYFTCFAHTCHHTSQV